MPPPRVHRHIRVRITLELVRYLESHRSRYTFLTATFSAGPAAALILASDMPVMDLGGFKGWDRVFNISHLASTIRRGRVRYFLFASDGSGAGVNGDLRTWVTQRCRVVPPLVYGSISSDSLYVCPPRG